VESTSSETAGRIGRVREKEALIGGEEEKRENKKIKLRSQGRVKMSGSIGSNNPIYPLCWDAASGADEKT
jgi:hypothetical protein